MWAVGNLGKYGGERIVVGVYALCMQLSTDMQTGLDSIKVDVIHPIPGSRLSLVKP